MTAWLRREGGPLALLLAAAIAFFWQSTLAGKVLLPVDNLFQFPPWSAYAPAGFSGPHNSLISDSILENYGWKQFLLDSLRTRQLPLWNPEVLGGTPFFAPAQAGVLYPFTILFLILPLAHAYGYFAALHLFLAGSFAYAFLRYSGASRTAGLIAGLTFMFSSRLVTSILWPQMIGAIVYLPLLLLVVEAMVRRARHSWPLLPVLGGGLVLSVSILAGHIEASVYVMAALALYGAGRLIATVLARELAAAGIGRGVSAIGALLGLGVGVAAVQLVPFYEVGSQNFRSGAVSYQDVVGFALKLPQLFTFLMPDFYGNPVISAPYWGPKDYVEQASYVGVLPLLLAGFTLLALLRGRNRHPDPLPETEGATGGTGRQIASLWLVIGVSLLLAFGTPLYRVIFFLAPGFNQIHSPFRWLIPYTGAMALLAGFGFDLVRQRLGLARLAFGAVALGGLAGVLVWRRVVLPHVPAPDDTLEVRNYAIFLALLVVASLILWAGRRTLAPLAVLLVAVDLGYFGISFNTAADPKPLDVVPGAVAFLQQDHSLFRVTAFGQDKMFEPNGNLLYGIQDARGYDSVILGRYAKLNDLLQPQDQLQFNRIKTLDQPSALDSPILDLLNVKYVLSSQAIDDASFRLVYDGADGKVYQNLRVLPRAFVASSSRLESSADAQLSALTQVDLASTAVLDRPLPNPLPVQPGTTGQATVTTYSGRKVSVQASGPGVLVLTDNIFPGWKVTMDGQPAELLTADYAFRGVVLPAGQHEVEFSFTPRSLIVGGLISGSSLALIVVLCVAYVYTRRVPVASLATTARVTKNSLAPLASNITSKLFGFGFSIFYFRELGPTQVGKYVVAVTLWLFMDTVIGFGLGQLVPRDVARDKDQTNRYLGNALLVRLTMSLLVGVPVLLGVFALQHVGRLSTDLGLTIALLTASFLPAAFSNVFSHIFGGHELMEFRAFVEVLTAIVSVGLGVVFVLAGWDIVGLAAASLLTNAFTAIVMGWLLSRYVVRPRLQFDPVLLGSIVRGAYPIMLNQLLVVLFFKIDVPILTAFRSSAEVALYGAAYKFVDAMLIIPSNFVPAVFPILSRHAASKLDALTRGYEVTLKVLLLIALPILAGFEVFAGDVMRGFYGEKYAASAAALRILMLFLPFSYVNGLTQYVLVALDRQHVMLRFFAVTAVFNVVVNLALIPRFGYIAASAVTAASEVVLMVPLVWLVGRRLGTPWTVPLVAARPAAAALAAGLLMLVLRLPAETRLGLLPGAVLAALGGGLLYGLLTLALGTFSAEELAAARGLLNRGQRLLTPGRAS